MMGGGEKRGREEKDKEGGREGGREGGEGMKYYIYCMYLGIITCVNVK